MSNINCDCGYNYTQTGCPNCKHIPIDYTEEYEQALANMQREYDKRGDRIEELEGQLKTVLDRETSILRYYDAKLDAAEAKLATMLVVEDAMAAFIEGNYYVSGIVKMWRGLAAVLKTNKLKGEQP